MIARTQKYGYFIEVISKIPNVIEKLNQSVPILLDLNLLNFMLKW